MKLRELNITNVFGNLHGIYEVPWTVSEIFYISNGLNNLLETLLTG